MVGRAIWHELERRGYACLIGATHEQVDLRDPGAVCDFFVREQPEFVFITAARVGGILANARQPVEFLLENLQIQNNLMEHAYLARVRKLLFLGSSCIYPRLAPQPLKERYLLTGLLEPTNEAYALAKIAGIKLCQAYRRQYGCDYISGMPCNLYGPNDHYDLQDSHVLPALIRKFHQAKIHDEKTVSCWGTGAPLREFLHVEDLARACIFLMENYSDQEFINVGSGSEISIAELARVVQRIVGCRGEIIWDKSKPDGTPRKLLDSSRIFALGWKPQIELETGIRQAYEDFLKRFPL